MANKIIAIQDGLDQVKEKLKSLGYETTNINNSNKPIDIIIYSNKGSNDYKSTTPMKNTKIPFYNQFVKMINVDEVNLENLIDKIQEIE